MTDRERWVVYPLLFLALGISLKDKMVREVQTDQLTCRRVVVVDRNDVPRVELYGEQKGGVVAISRGNPPQEIKLPWWAPLLLHENNAQQQAAGANP